jgi:hypothetical protein
MFVRETEGVKKVEFLRSVKLGGLGFLLIVLSAIPASLRSRPELSIEAVFAFFLAQLALALIGTGLVLGAIFYTFWTDAKSITRFVSGNKDWSKR